MRKLALAAAIALASFALAWASDSFSRGEELFLRNKPKEAIPLLEAAVKEDPSLEKAYLYLGIAYQQLSRLDDAVSALRKGLPKAVLFRHLFYFNLGNLYFAQGKNAFAEDMYAEAMKADPGYAGSYLNRGNVRVNLKKYADAIADYRSYLELEPASPKRDKVELMIKALTAGVEDAAAAAKAEEDRKQAAADAEAARLAELAKSLSEAADETRSLSAGSEGVEGYGEELKLGD